jgi:hemerythrin-like domain-containing protein
MQSDHDAIDAALAAARKAVAELVTDASEEHRTSAGEAIVNATTVIDRHLALEESDMLTFIDRYLTQDEWASVPGHGLEELAPEVFPVMFGMLLEDMTPQI